MRNFKKVLSLVLCLAMMLSIMVVGAGAAFKDQEKIVNTEAVDACVALNIINGYTDGSYKPEGTITRAEACKMICVALNGGEEPTLGTNAKASFTDTKGHWAEGYIESCVAQGIVAGIGGGKFNPNGNVTGTQFAKMLLIALGYNADNAGYTGASWEVNVNVDASSKGLYVDLSGMDPSKALSRDNAAQMVWNALNAYEVEYKYNLVSENGQLVSKLTLQDKVVGNNNDKITLLEDKYEAKAITGTLTDVSKDNGKETYNITIDNPKYNGAEYEDYTGKYYDDNDKETGDTYSTWTDVTKDYSNLLYQNVRVLVKPDKNGKDAVVYGVYATNKNTVQSGILADLELDSASKVKLDGTKYDLSKNGTVVYVNGERVTNANCNTIAKWVGLYGDDADTPYVKETGATNLFLQGTEVELLATDGTTNYSILKVVTHQIAKVTAVGSDYINVSLKGGDPGITNKAKLEADDWDYPSDISKDDYVVLTAGTNYASGNGLVEKADVVSGKVTGLRGSADVGVDGSWYTIAGNASENALVKKQPSTGSNLEMVVVNGYVYYYDTSAGNVEDVALMVEAAPTGGTGSKWEARLIFANGSDKVVSIEKYWGDKDNKNFPIAGTYDLDANNDGKIDESEGGILVTYETSGGVYTLTKLGEQSIDDNEVVDGDYETGGYDVVATATNMWTDGSIKQNASKSANGTITMTDDSGKAVTNTANKLYYESTGVVFVKYKGTDGMDADYKVVTGKAASDYDKAVKKMEAVADKSGSNYYAQAAFIDLDDQSTGGTSDNYAVVLKKVETDASSSSKVYTIYAWNGSEPITVITDDSNAKNLGKGSIFSYTGSLDNADIDVCSGQANYYVGAYDEGSGDITLYTDKNSTPVGVSDKYGKIDSGDTIVFYVDSDANAGVTEGVIDLAYWYDDDFAQSELAVGDQNANVRCYFDDDDYITVIVVDVNRDITEW